MHARIAALVSALGGGLGCVSVVTSETEENSTAELTDQPEQPCHAPPSFEAHYADGSVLLRAKPAEGERGVTEWIYYLPSGTPVIAEKHRDGRIVHVTTLHPNGKPHIQGDLAIDSETSVSRADGVWEMTDPNGTMHARALMSEGELHLTSAQEWDANGEEHDWSLPAELFIFQEAGALAPIQPPLPTNAFTETARQRTCTLVCLDEKGEQQGIFRLTRSGPGFDEASEAAIRETRFHPRKIGAEGLPSCIAISIPYELMWATKVLRLPRPVQRRPRGRY